MKTTTFLDDLNLDRISSLTGLQPSPALPAASSADWAALKACLHGRSGRGVDTSRVAAVQRAIAAGRYVANAVDLAERVLASIAAGRRH